MASKDINLIDVQGSKARLHTQSVSSDKKLSKVRYTITVSPKTEERILGLKEYTQSETISEVFREAVNIAAMLMKLEREGVHLEIVDPTEPDKRERLVIGNRVAA